MRRRDFTTLVGGAAGWPLTAWAQRLAPPIVGFLRSEPITDQSDLVREFRERHIPHKVVTLRCGHYTTGKTPFKFVDGWVLTRFLKRNLRA